MPVSDGSLAAFINEPVTRAFIGLQADQFIARWESKFSVADRTTVIPLKASFNGLSVFFGLFYVFYRKMYGLAAIIAGVALLQIVVETVVGIPALLGQAISFGLWFGFGFLFDSLYLRHVIARVRHIKLTQPDPQLQIAIASKAGGTSWVACIVGIAGFFVVGIVLVVVMAGLGMAGLGFEV